MIYTVDDFGINKQANELIFEAFDKKIITHASTMVNMPGSNQALKAAGEYEKIKFGLHLNLTKPVRSVFAIKAEIERQIAKLQNCVGKIEFINSHHNVHFLPFVLPVIIKLAKENGITKIRLPRKFVGQGLKPFLIKMATITKVEEGFRLSNTWLDLDWYVEAKMKQLIKNLPAETEISCHPLIFQKYRRQSTLQWLIENKSQLS